ncbi:DUF4214 domain-containing protein [Massilia violaceinigra]|uniref:DUF4214 domain-containing protein n=1 Tax=Massilia violaceinigra TaxID=2045208 RepID=A0ABY4A8M5_9BURK|nr:DUF4214 domain-containing protein [Massilia violaceinigra]UOD31176.1 DUF4214 domain-containing protein [Massilia violaceinigra]
MAVATEYTKVAQELYLSYFGRPADSTGLKSMTEALAAAKAPTDTAGLAVAYNTNPAVKQLMDNFGNSAESAALYPGSTADFLKGVYLNLFGRAPDAEGQAYWTKQIDTGVVSKGAAAYNILTGAIDAKGADAQTVAKKVVIATAFTTAIDTAAEVKGYDGNFAAGEARKLLANVNANTDATVYQATVNSVLASLALGTTPGATIRLTEQRDTLVGTDANDTFNATIFDNQNTLQGGDEIAAGGGNDTLRADIGKSQQFAFRPETTGVENVILSAQTIGPDATDNNTVRTVEVQLDAERMRGVTRFEDSNSRADLVIEDIRILDSQITKDITIAMVQTDPGNVDFGVLFDQHSLRAAPVAASGATLRLQLMDTRASDQGLAKLLDNPYNGFIFSVDGKAIKVASQAIDQAQTYAELVTAVQAAIKLTPGIENFTVKLGDQFIVADTKTGRAQTGNEIVITNPGAGTITLPKGSGWTAEAAVPPDSGLHTAILQGNPTSVVSKITSTVILDDVGRGSNGGDLVIGGLSIGDTSTSKGVERFEITVERTSRLQTINSTDNFLQEVILVNGVTKGDLYVNGNANLKSVATAGTAPNGGQVTMPGLGSDTPLPGTDTINGGKQHGDQYGFHDVRFIDASTLVGNLALTAVITDRSVAKYINKIDTQSNSAADNVAFSYTGGLNNDTIVVDLDAGVAGSRSQIISGLEDFTFNLNGNSGNDALTLRIVPAVAGGGTFWNSNQDLNNNIVISGGDGNDTIRKLGDGDTRIEGGAGDDTIYSENTGATNLFSIAYGTGAVGTPAGPGGVPAAIPGTGAIAAPTTATWAFNTTDQVTLAPADRFVGNMRSDFNDSYFLYNATVNVTYKGITSSLLVSDGSYKLTDLQINQAIKKIITDSPVLNKLLLATDSPSGALTVTALTDGLHVVGDLTVGLVAPTSTLNALSTSDLAAAAAAYGITSPAADGSSVYAAMVAALTTFNTTNGDYASNFATAYTDASLLTLGQLTGAESTAVSDNIITPGSGNDVIALGNHEALNAGAQILAPTVADYAISDNETVVYAAGFGNDTIVNFDVIGAGIDHLDFTAIGGNVLTGAVSTNKSITIGTPTLATAALSTTAIAALYTADNTAAQTHVYVAVDATTHVGTVYSIVDAIGAANAAVTLEGTIDLASTGNTTVGANNWAALTQANFVNSSAANYYLLEGASGFIAPVVVTPTPGVAVALNNTVPGYNAGNNTNVTFTAASNQTFSSVISNFAAGDKLLFAPGTVVTVADGVASDNVVTVTGVNGAFTSTVTVQTQSPAVFPSPLNSVAAFNSFFGAGSLVDNSTTPVAVNSGNLNFDAANNNFVFNVATGTYTANVANFAASDVLSFVTGSAVTINNVGAADGIVDIVAVNGATTTTIHLTGVSGAIDGVIGVNPAATVTTFNTAFGAGSLVIAA